MLHLVSEFTFQLTGSRFFGSSQMGSDWDYFVQDSPEVRMWLETKGFMLLSSSKYSDNHTVEVFRGQWSDLSVDVQLVKDFNTKLLVQEKLLESGVFRNRLDKSVQRKIWNLLLL